MAWYLLRSQNDDGAFKNDIVESESAHAAVNRLETTNATIEVWTLRSGESRIFEVTTESVRTVKRVE